VFPTDAALSEKNQPAVFYLKRAVTGAFLIPKPMLLNKTLAIGISLITTALAAPRTFGQQTLDVQISNVRKNSGKIVVEIYNNESSWLKSPFRKTVLPTNEANKTASFEVPPGRYAISVYQDVNENGELDRTFIGIPKEPVGFGNNYKPFGKPKFESATIEYKPAAKPQEIKLFEAL
jgi:uncharacterized protein (DUF2141 family)